MNKENNEYLQQHQRLLSENITTPSEKADIIRKCLVHSYTASLNLMDNDANLTLLESNLKNYTKFLRENPSVFDEPLCKRLEELKIPPRNNIRSGITKSSFLSSVKPMPCTNTGELHCSNSENENPKEFQEFLSMFINEKKVKDIQKQSILIENLNNFESHQKFGRSLNFNRNEPLVRRSDGNTSNENMEANENKFGFKSAKEELEVQNLKKYGNINGNSTGQKRRLGMAGGVRRKFVSPLLSNGNNCDEKLARSQEEDEPVDERLKNIDPKMIELIRSEIMDIGPKIHWDDIAGLEFAKTAIQEAVVWPMLRPDIFTGLRRPPKGILLFGPPGTGKTLIGKCIASQSKSTFFSISASSLTSKWIGDGEKMVRALFSVARVHQPSVIFIDEIDSLLSQRSEQEHESSRRLKTEFLVQLDGATTDNEERILLVGATNRPQELDEAARRRFVKRLYIPLPEFDARLQLVMKLMITERNSLNHDDFIEIAKLSDGYSGADIRNLCSEACLGPIRSIDMTKMQSIQVEEVRPVTMCDFKKAFSRVRSSVAPKDLEQYTVWDSTYGSGSFS